MTYRFRCRSNPQGPILELRSHWEAKEMMNHPDYDRVDEHGLPMVNEDDMAEQTIPVRPPSK